MARDPSGRAKPNTDKRFHAKRWQKPTRVRDSNAHSAGVRRRAKIARQKSAGNPWLHKGKSLKPLS
jgi:hypothetical protein